MKPTTAEPYCLEIRCRNLNAIGQEVWELWLDIYLYATEYSATTRARIFTEPQFVLQLFVKKSHTDYHVSPTNH